MSELVIEERHGQGTVLLRLNRPEAHNALSDGLRKALTDRFAALYDDPTHAASWSPATSVPLSPGRISR